MEMLCLKSIQLANLESVISDLESKNGASMYTSSISCSYSCDEWDCAISCHCANSRN